MTRTNPHARSTSPQRRARGATLAIIPIIAAMISPTFAAAQPPAATTPPAAPKAPTPPTPRPADSRVPPRYTAPGNREIKFPSGVYDDVTDGAQILREAMTLAKNQNKRVLVTWGENQCGFCAYLSDLIWYESPGCRTLLDSEYVVAKLDVAKSFTKNNDLAQRYGATKSHQMEDAPRLTIIDPVTDQGVGTLSGKDLIAKPMTMEKIFDEAAVLAFLENNKAPARPAVDVLDSAMKAAIYKEQNVLVFFTSANASCDTCAQWSAWLAKPEVKTVLEKAFSVATIDADRMTGGQSFLERFADKRPIMAPALAVVTDRGVRLDPAVTVTAFPRTGEAIAAFTDSLARAAGKKMSAEMKASLVASLASPAQPK